MHCNEFPWCDGICAYDIHSLHDCEVLRLIYSPKENYSFQGQRPSEIQVFGRNISSYLPNVHAINCLLLQTTDDNVNEYIRF